MSSRYGEGPVGRIVLFIGAISSLDAFILEMKDGFEDIGYETMVFDARDPGKSFPELMAFFSRPVTAVVTFNNLGFSLGRDEGKIIWDGMGFPVINILVDAPCYFDSELNDPPKNGVVLTIDRDHMQFVTRFFPKVGITGFLPHGGFMPRRPVRPIRERSIDVVYVGSAHGKPAGGANILCDRYDTDSEEGVFREKVRCLMCDDPSLTLEAAVENIMAEQGYEMSDDEIFRRIHDLRFMQIEMAYAYRDRIIRSLLRDGIRLTLCGAGWENSDWQDDPGLDYRGILSFYDALDIMLDAKIVLSTTTWFKDGSHERVFNGMLAGAVVMSEASRYLREEFDDGEIVFFELTQTDMLADIINDTLADPDRMQQIADSGRKKAEERHTWQHRVKELHEELLTQL